MRFRLLLLFCLMGAVNIWAADLTGMWSGTMEAVDHPAGNVTDRHYFSVKQSGDTLSGTVGPERDGPFAVKDAKLNGTKLVFDVAASGSGGLALIYDLQVTGDQMTGKVEAKNRPGLKWKLTLKKEK